MMNQQGILRDHGEAGRWRTSLLGLAVLVVTLIAALLVSTSTAGSGEPTPVIVDIGRLELVANDASDEVVFKPTSGDDLYEKFTTGGQSRLVESNGAGGTEDLVTLEAMDGVVTSSGTTADVGLKDHGFGVRADRGGQRAAQITGDQELTINLDGIDMPGDGATFGELSFKAKFNSTITVRGYNGDDEVAFGVEECDGGSDCGPDSGRDRVTVNLDNLTPDNPQPFTRVVIRVDPIDGAATLIDDDVSEGGPFETFFNIVDYFDGQLACDEDTGQPDGAGDDVNGKFTRLNTADVAAGCNLPPKLFNFDVGVGEEGPELSFEPNDAGPVAADAAYRGDIRFAASPANPIGADLEYDADGPGTERDFVPMQWCALPPGDVTPDDWEYQTDPDGDGGIEIGDLYFPEYAGLGTGGDDAHPVDAHPVMPTTLDADGSAPTSCIVAFSSEGLHDDWVVYAEADPRYR